MAAESSKVILGLPSLPGDYLPRELYPEFLTIYKAIQNLLLGVSRWTGIDGPDDVEQAEMIGWEFLLAQQMSYWYPVNASGGTINRGQCVRVIANNQVTFAQANNMVNAMIGVAEETKGAGQKIKVCLFGMTDAISGMTAGTLYYLSPTVAGAVQNLAPITPGEIVQGVGRALDADHMWLNPSTFIRQL